VSSIRKASTDDLGPCLTQLIRQAYEPVFAIIDPVTVTPQQLSDAFRGFKPPGQRERMVTLFTGLMAFAGMIESVPKRTPGPRPKTRGEQTNGARTAKQAAPSADGAPITTKAPNFQQADAHARTVTLRTGGSITLSVDMNPLVLRGSERKFFNALVDLLDEYEDDSPLALPAGATIVQPEV